MLRAMLVKETVIMMTSAKENTRAEITTVRMGTPEWIVVFSLIIHFNFSHVLSMEPYLRFATRS